MGERIMNKSDLLDRYKALSSSEDLSDRELAKIYAEIYTMYIESDIEEVSDEVKLSLCAEETLNIYSELQKLTPEVDYSLYIRAARSLIIDYMTEEEIQEVLKNYNEKTLTESSVIRFLNMYGYKDKYKYSVIKNLVKVMELTYKSDFGENTRENI